MNTLYQFRGYNVYMYKQTAVRLAIIIMFSFANVSRA